MTTDRALRATRGCGLKEHQHNCRRRGVPTETQSGRKPLKSGGSRREDLVAQNMSRTPAHADQGGASGTISPITDEGEGSDGQDDPETFDESGRD